MGQSRPDKLRTNYARCPICADPAEFEFRPFCSRRCANLDLSRWLTEAYAIPVLPDEDEDGNDVGIHNSRKRGEPDGQD